MASRPLPDFAPLLAGIARELRARRLPFMFVGGQAVLLHGAPRLTTDIDLTLGVGPQDIASVEAVGRRLELASLVPEPASFAAETFVWPTRHPSSGIRVDFIFSNTTYEQAAIARATHVELAGASLPVAAPEDLILLKLFAGRPRDVEDARSVVARQGERLNWPYLEHWAGEFSAIPGREDLPAQVRALRSA